MTVDRRCLTLASGFLAPYRLSPAERQQEVEALAQQIQVAIEAHLESLEHRRA